MPEGDTVLRTARRLDQALAGRPLVRTELRWPTLGEADLAGRTVTEVVAYGKQILTRIAAVDPDAPQPRIPTEAESSLIGHLGPDIMADDFNPDGAIEAARRLTADPGRHVGAALLDQTTVAGIGTMYMAEALFVQKISPWTPVAEVDVPAVLATARRQLLRGAAQAVPSTTGNPRRGMQTYVHGRSGRPCQRCGGTVRVAEIGPAGKRRPAFYCPACQPGPTPTDTGRPQRPLGASPAYREFRRPTGYR
jgi:endonuclease-8